MAYLRANIANIRVNYKIEIRFVYVKPVNNMLAGFNVSVIFGSQNF